MEYEDSVEFNLQCIFCAAVLQMWFSNVSLSQGHLLPTYWRRGTAENVMLQIRPFNSWYILVIPHTYSVAYGFIGCHNDWCFLCQFEIHVDEVRRSSKAFSPVNILSRLPNIGGTLGYGRQEDAHEFMRFICS